MGEYGRRPGGGRSAKPGGTLAAGPDAVSALSRGASGSALSRGASGALRHLPTLRAGRIGILVVDQNRFLPPTLQSRPGRVQLRGEARRPAEVGVHPADQTAIGGFDLLRPGLVIDAEHGARLSFTHLGR